MSETKISIQNDNDKDVKKDNIPEQTSLDSSFDMHAGENEEKHVRRSVLRTKEEHKAGGGESKIDLTKGSNKNLNTYEKEYTVGYNQPPPGQGQGWFSQGPPQGQGQGWFSQGPPQGQGQGWFSQGPPQGQGQGWFSQGPPQGQPPQQENRGFGHIHARHADYHSGPPLDYSADKEDRNAFVRKVLVILLVMLLITSAVMTAVLMITPARLFFRRFGVFIAVPCVIILMVMSCYMPTSTCARKSPTNYLCLALVVILETLFCCAITCRYDTVIILQAFIATMACVLVCVLLACSRFDFTKCLLIVVVLSVAAFVLLLIIVVCSLVLKMQMKAAFIAILVVFTLLNVWMLTIELQMIIGGKSVEISEEDYALGAYMLYTSIIQLFVTLVQLLGLIN